MLQQLIIASVVIALLIALQIALRRMSAGSPREQTTTRGTDCLTSQCGACPRTTDVSGQEQEPD